MTKQEFLETTVSQVSQVYNGKRAHCRCGCGGTYISTSFMIKPRNEINDKLAERRLKKAQKLVLEGKDFDSSYNYFDVETGNNRCLTFYFDEIKN
jgi:hypothetical protein